MQKFNNEIAITYSGNSDLLNANIINFQNVNNETVICVLVYLINKLIQFR